jgi:hypothetical protein
LRQNICVEYQTGIDRPSPKIQLSGGESAKTG